MDKKRWSRMILFDMGQPFAQLYGMAAFMAVRSSDQQPHTRSGDDDLDLPLERNGKRRSGDLEVGAVQPTGLWGDAGSASSIGRGSL
jgi:hypothetical protein